MKKRTYLSILVKILVVASMFLVGACTSNNLEKQESSEPIQEVINEETIQEESTVEIIEEVTTEEEDTTEESEEIVEIDAPCYLLHVGIAKDIELKVTRIYSDYSYIGNIIPEYTRLYDGDILTATVSTTNKFSTEPIYCFDQVIDNKDQTYTVSGQDVIVTTGYYEEPVQTQTQLGTIQFVDFDYTTLDFTVTLNVSGAAVHCVGPAISGNDYTMEESYQNPCTYYKNALIDDGNEDITIIATCPGYADFTITINLSNYCLLPGSLITLSDGSKVKVEDLNLSETLMTYNFMIGDVDSNKVAVITKHSNVNINALHIVLDNGNYLDICQCQTFFDMDAKELIDISANNYQTMIGKRIMCIEDGKRVTRTISDITCERKTTDVYEVMTNNDVNFVANDMLTYEPDSVFNGVFEIDDEYKIDQVQLQADIKKYGLYNYSDYKDVISFEYYMNTPVLKYVKIAEGKGIVNHDDFIEYLSSYYDLYEANNYYVAYN